MKINHHSDFIQTKWEGGTTTEIYIHPNTALFSERNFDWRVSVATVNNVQSEFTSFHGYNRFIVPLSGDLSLIHVTEDGEFEQALKPFELGVFNGAWKTKAKGIVTDFNLIFKENLIPSLRKIENCSQLSEGFSLDKEHYLYVHEGSFTMRKEKIPTPFFLELTADSLPYVLSENQLVAFLISL